MEYPTPNPGPCRGCNRRIWHGGSLCSDCYDANTRKQERQDKAARKLKRLEIENKKLRADLKEGK